MIWNRLGCDLCGMLGPALSGRPRATLLRKESAKIGWDRPQIGNAVRDICPTCSRMPYDDLYTHFKRQTPPGEAPQLLRYKDQFSPMAPERPGLTALWDDDDYFADED